MPPYGMGGKSWFRSRLPFCPPYKENSLLHKSKRAVLHSSEGQWLFKDAACTQSISLFFSCKTIQLWLVSSGYSIYGFVNNMIHLKASTKRHSWTKRHRLLHNGIGIDFSCRRLEGLDFCVAIAINFVLFTCLHLLSRLAQQTGNTFDLCDLALREL